ncbi:hypothetical protein BDV96DRAFT_645256 [Lophiotrema nucula]|uniref:Uncharacterized protein n=1 Tax=Lophiotrema nucula TaxID=690887 RepID=A0A6A5ZBK0_9PLEO|nr:hypothetical protein BDV96DRAFT_645256 [Lophiotrema nucula]
MYIYGPAPETGYIETYLAIDHKPTELPSESVATGLGQKYLILGCQLKVMFQDRKLVLQFPHEDWLLNEPTFITRISDLEEESAGKDGTAGSKTTAKYADGFNPRDGLNAQYAVSIPSDVACFKRFESESQDAILSGEKTFVDRLFLLDSLASALGIPDGEVIRMAKVASDFWEKHDDDLKSQANNAKTSKRSQSNRASRRIVG